MQMEEERGVKEEAEEVDEENMAQQPGSQA